MKIGIIAHDYYPIVEPFQGGLEKFTHLLVKELVHRGHEVFTLCNKGSELDGIMIFYSALGGNWEGDPATLELSKFEQFYSSINNFMSTDFDVIHNHTINHHAIIFGSVIDVPFITSFHCPMFANIYAALNAVKTRPNQIFTTVSNHLNVDFRKVLKNVRTVYNGIDLSKWSISPFKENYFSWCGRICKEKGLAEIIDLCAIYNLELKIAGPISDLTYYDEYIRPRLTKYKKCEYLGHLNQSEVNQLISRSKALLFSSTWQEPYGLVIAEALACGTPVIANNIGAADEILTDKSGILFDIDEPATFGDATSNVNKISPTDCRERAEKFCSHIRMVDAYLEIYTEII